MLNFSVSGKSESFSKFFTPSTDIPVFDNTEEHLSPVEWFYMLAEWICYETNTENVDQEFFDAPESCGAKSKLEVYKHILAISPTHPSEDSVHHSTFSSRTLPAEPQRATNV